MAETKKKTVKEVRKTSAAKPSTNSRAKQSEAPSIGAVAKKQPVASDGTAGPRIRIRLKAYDHKIIDSAAKTIVDTALRSGAKVIGPVPLPVKTSTFTVVKSPHVFKKGGEAFEMRVHKRLIDIVNATPKTIDSLQNLQLPAGVDAEIRM